MEYRHTILQKHGYQVVALTRDSDPAYAPDEVIGYAVITDSGAKLREEPSLEEARLYMEQLLEEDRPSRSDDARPRRRKSVRPKVAKQVR
ncbi:hypothetical protein [Pseudoxanthomonas sp.]|uniref:hypothetical protein n=1 Tax=Pseudoxanthomonas sp. TaxID=1871049 RepID=UPI002617F757|nr:hypothetical protein [Pseudoxanthomonas sp.]WDS36043.1 MAG: hypothetical protein O8I58_17370 [Pseudoxanthomonas sp.]